jgi:probable HAF family extracellular repeat protein
VPGSTFTGARGINTSGQIVGWYGDARGIEHGFLLDVDGGYTTLDPPGAIQTEVNGVNDSGQKCWRAAACQAR